MNPNDTQGGQAQSPGAGTPSPLNEVPQTPVVPTAQVPAAPETPAVPEVPAADVPASPIGGLGGPAPAPVGEEKPAEPASA